MKYGIVVFPSKEIQDFANSYRKRYDTHYAYLSPHITLRYEAEIDDQAFSKVAEELHKIAQQTKPFAIYIPKVSTFNPVNNVIYLKVNPNEDITSLNQALHTGFFDKTQQYQYVPHITLAQGITAGELDDLYGQLKMLPIDFTDTIDRIHLLYELEDGTWTVYETYRLKGA